MRKSLNGLANEHQYVSRCGLALIRKELHQNREDLLSNVRELDGSAVQRAHQQLSIATVVLLRVVGGLVDFL